MAHETTNTRWWHRSFAFDWAGVFVTGFAAFCLEHAEPFQRVLGPQRHDPSIQYPHKESAEAIIPTVTLVYLCTLVPVLMLCAFIRPTNSRQRGVLHSALLGLCVSVAACFLLTNIVKLSVGRFRPDFIARCRPDDDNICHGNPAVVQQGRKSFPSGHTSLSSASWVYLAIVAYALTNNISTQRFGFMWKYMITLALWLVPLLIGLSRIADYWHHWQDVLVGSLLGHATALCSFYSLFDSPHQGLTILSRHQNTKMGQPPDGFSHDTSEPLLSMP